MTRSGRAWRLACLALVSAAAAANAWHLLADRQPPSWDDAWYLENSFRFFTALKAGPLAFAREYVDAFHTKAPLVSVLPLPLYAVFGMGERVALWAGQACWLAAVALVGLLGARVHDEKTGWAAAAIYALMPLGYGLSRVFFVEPVLTALVCGFYLALTRPQDRAAGARLGALGGLGLLAKSVFPLYAAGGVWKARRQLAPHATRAAAVCAVVAGTWYAANLPYVAGYAFSAGFGSVARDYGEASALSPAVLQQYALRVGRDAFSWPLLAAAAAVVFLAGPRRRLAASDSLALWWLGVPLAVFTLGVNKEVRFLAPVLPAVALLLAPRAAAAAETRLGRRLLPALACLPLLVLCAQTWGWPAGRALAYNGAALEDGGWDRGAIVSSLEASASERSVVAVAFEHRLLNANNLASLSASRGHPWRFVSLGYAQTSAEGALIRLKDKGADHLVLVEGEPDGLPAFLNRANAGVAAALASGRLKGALLARVPLGAGLTAAVYRLAR